jgi:hypothetical protein
MDRFTWGIVVGVLALVVAGIAAATLVRGREVPPDTSTPSGVVLAFEQALQDGDAERAWDLLASTTQAAVGRNRFLQRASGSARGSGSNQVRLIVENERVTGDSAVVDLVRTYRSSGLFDFGGGDSPPRYVVRLVRENGAWRITVPADSYLVAELGERFP